MVKAETDIISCYLNHVSEMPNIPWSPFLTHCSFWTSCKVHYGKWRLMTQCNVLKLLKVFGFPLISFTTGWKMILFFFFFTVIICLTSQILCRWKTPSELCVCWDLAHKSLALSRSSFIITFFFQMWIFILSLLVKTSESFQQKLS